MMALKAVEPVGPFWSVEAVSAFVREVDCDKYSPDRGSPECEERAQTGLGVILVGAVLLLVVGFIVWRCMLRKVDKKSTMRDWRHRRRERDAEQEAFRQQLREEYLERLDSCDRDALESSRDYGDNDSTPWRVEAGMGLAFVGMLALFAIVAALILFFTWIQHLTAG